MYNYEWDKATGGYILLPGKIIGVTKEIRPVFAEELRFLKLDEDYGWGFPDCDEPLMWAEAKRYIYRGELVAEVIGGNLYEMPTLKNVVNNLQIEPVDLNAMIEKNNEIMNGLVQTTLKSVYKTYIDYLNKVSIFYVAFSGGKDSLVALDIVQRALPNDNFVVVFGDTTMELSVTYETIAKAKEHWSTLSWHIAKTDFDAVDSWSKIGYPARKLRWCCGVHKSAPSIALLRDIYSNRSEETGDKIFKVMVFDGVRAEESDARSTYSMISDGKKHAVQYNCSPILEWNSSELFLYIFKHNLPLNRLYRLGSHRVGCKLCPMASEWYECIINYNFSDEIAPLLNIVTSGNTKKFSSKKEQKKYLQNGGWKSRVGGKDLIIGENKLLEIKSDSTVKFVLTNNNYKWDKWMNTIGTLVQVGNNVYSIQYKDLCVNFNVRNDNNSTTIEMPTLIRSPLSVRFMYLFKNALNKAAYCVNCGECVAECAFNALKITKDNIAINDCKHCEQCLDSYKGCIAARSLSITGGGNNMSAKNINRYQNFGFRKEWLDLYFETNDDFWTNDRMGKYMLVGFKVWLKEAGITDNNALTDLGKALKKLSSDSTITWGIIYSNLCYNSPIINWYAKNIEYNCTYKANDLPLLLGEDYSETTKKNALSSLKETLRYSPIGSGLGQGECEIKGKQVVSIIKTGWQNPEPIVILYTLYKFAENMDSLYSFTLSDLVDDREERAALSPSAIFGISKDELRPILQGLANNFPKYITVDFNKGIMENIDLSSGKNGKTAADILSLI